MSTPHFATTVMVDAAGPMVGAETDLPAQQPTVKPPFGHVVTDDRVRIVASRPASSPAHATALPAKEVADGHAVPAWGKGAPDAGTDIDGLQFVRNDQEVAAMVRTFEMIGRARERADAVGAEAASREF